MAGAPRMTNVVDLKVFDKILELDDNDGCAFTQSLAEDYFSLAKKARKDMTTDLQNLDYKNLSSRARRLTESSTTMGFTAVTTLLRRISDDASTVARADSAEVMQRQRIQLRQHLVALSNQIKRTESSVNEILQKITKGKRRPSLRNPVLSESFSKLLSVV